MTSPLGDSTSVHYTATATFAQVIAEARKAERAINDLEKAEKNLSRTAEDGSRRVAAAAKERADSIRSSTAEIDRAVSANDKYSRSFDAITRKADASRKSLSDLERVAKTFASTNDRLAASFDRVNRSQSGRSNFATNTKRGIDEASAAVEKFENRLQALFATAGNQAIDLNVNTESALNEIAKLAAEIQLLTRGVNEVEIRVNSNSTMLEVRSLARNIKKELGSAIDADVLGQTQAKFREIARDIAADAAEFRREQARLDRELLEEQLELEGRLTASRTSVGSSRTGRSDSDVTAEFSEMLEDNRSALKSIADAFENSVEQITSKLDELKVSADATRELTESFGESGKETAQFTKKVQELEAQLDALGKKEEELARQNSKLTAQKISDDEKIRRSKTASDVAKLRGDDLYDEAKRLGIPRSSGGKRVPVDDLRAEIARRYAEDTLFAEKRNKEREALKEKEADLRKEVLATKAALEEQADLRRAAIKKESDERAAATTAATDARRKADRLELLEYARKEREKQEIRRQAAKDQSTRDSGFDEYQRDLARKVKEFEKETEVSTRSVAKIFHGIKDKDLRDSLKSLPDDNIFEDIAEKSEDARTRLEKDILVIARRVQEFREKAYEASAAATGRAAIADSLTKAAPVAAALDREVRERPDEIEEKIQFRQSFREEAERRYKEFLYYSKLQESEEQKLISAVARAEREKSAIRTRELREQQRESARTAKELERISKLPASEQFKLWAKDAVQSIGLVILNTQKGSAQLRDLDKAAQKLYDKDTGKLKTDDDSVKQLELLRRKYREVSAEIADGEHAVGRFRAAGARIAEIFRNDVRGGFTTNLVRGLSQLGDASTDALKKLTRLSGELYRMPGIILLLISSISGLIAGLGAAGAGFIGLANAAVSAVGVLGAVPGLVAAIGSAFGAVTVGSRGISDVFSAARKSQDESAKAAKKGSDDSVSSARQQRAAARGLRDAYENLTDAQNDQKKAQLDVAKAWREAKEDLIDLQFTVRQGVIDEERAIINLRKARLELARIQAGGSEDPKREKEALLKLQEARREYNKILADGNSTAIERAKVLRRVSEAEIRYAEASRSKAKPGDRREAELDVKDAELALERIRNTNRKNQDELKKIQREGLGSTDRVINANDRLAASNDRVRDAQEAVTEAQLRIKELQEDSAKGSDKAATAADELEAALGKLGPKTRIVVEAMLDLIPAYDAMQDRIGDRLFGPISDDTDRFVDVLEIAERVLGKAADAMGYLLEVGLKLVTSGPWKRDFGTIADSNYRIIKNLGLAIFGVASAFKDITVAAEDFTEDFAAGLAQSGEDFAAWAARVRADGSLKRFLENSAEDIDVLKKIFGDLLAITVSYFKATEEQGDYILERIKLLTARWREVAKEQEKAGSGLKTFLEDSRPALSALVSLLGAVAKGFASIASDPKNLEAATNIFKVLEHDILPPLIDFLNEFSQSDIAPRIAKAVGDIIDAIAQFLDSGGGEALAKYFDVLAYGIGLITDLVTLPGVKEVFGALAKGIAIFAAAATIAKFAGLFKLWDFFKWVVNNKKSVTDGLAAAGQAASGDSDSKGTRTPNFPGTGDGERKRRVIIDSDDIDAEASKTEKAADKVDKAADKVDKSSGKLSGASGKLKKSVGGLGDALGQLADGLGGGGVVGVALVAATLTVGYYKDKIDQTKERIDLLKEGLLGAAEAFKTTGAATSDAIKAMVKDSTPLLELLSGLDNRPNITGASSATALSGLNGNFEDYRKTVDAFNDEINDPKDDAKEILGGILNYASYGKLSTDAFDNKEQVKEQRAAYRKAFEEQEKAREEERKATQVALDYTAARRASILANTNYATASPQLREELEKTADATIQFSDAMKILNDPLSTVDDKLLAVKSATQAVYGEIANEIDQEDQWQANLLSLKEQVEANGTSLKNNTREGINNREMLKRLASQTRDSFEQDVKSGKSVKEATERHKERTEALKAEYINMGFNKEEVGKLIKVYGDIPTNIQTTLSLLGDGEVREKIISLLALILQGKNPKLTAAQALTETRRDAAAADRAASSGKKPYIYTEADKKRLGLAYGGFVSGPGGPRDDMIPAWLSNREFVQPADATEHYGVPFMEKIRSKKIPKQAAQKLVGETFSNGGHVGCADCASGAHPPRFAKGGQVSFPAPMDVSTFKTDFDVSAESYTPFTGEFGSGKAQSNWRWIVAAAKSAFPRIGVYSTVRPGDRTLYGNISYHSSGRAVDFEPNRALAEFFIKNYGKQIKEQITPWRELNILNGRPYRYQAATERQHGIDARGGPNGTNRHNHIAFRQGGLVGNVLENLSNFAGMGMTAPTMKMAPTPRALSPAAHSVINNQGDKETNYNITVNNPVAERGGDSIRNSLARTVYLYDN